RRRRRCGELEFGFFICLGLSDRCGLGGLKPGLLPFRLATLPQNGIIIKNSQSLLRFRIFIIVHAVISSPSLPGRPKSEACARRAQD
ncbi:hypothetical protein AKJ16_DCAP13970, partial [Drosera capensis]